MITYEKLTRLTIRPLKESGRRLEEISAVNATITEGGIVYHQNTDGLMIKTDSGVIVSLFRSIKRSVTVKVNPEKPRKDYYVNCNEIHTALENSRLVIL